MVVVEPFLVSAPVGGARDSTVSLDTKEEVDSGLFVGISQKQQSDSKTTVNDLPSNLTQ